MGNNNRDVVIFLLKIIPKLCSLGSSEGSAGTTWNTRDVTTGSA